MLVERGAIGVIVLNNAEDEARFPWTRAADNWNKPGMRLRGADGKGAIRNEKSKKRTRSMYC